MCFIVYSPYLSFFSPDKATDSDIIFSLISLGLRFFNLITPFSAKLSLTKSRKKKEKKPPWIDLVFFKKKSEGVTTQRKYLDEYSTDGTINGVEYMLFDSTWHFAWCTSVKLSYCFADCVQRNKMCCRWNTEDSKFLTCELMTKKKRVSPKHRYLFFLCVCFFFVPSIPPFILHLFSFTLSVWSWLPRENYIWYNNSQTTSDELKKFQTKNSPSISKNTTCVSVQFNCRYFILLSSAQCF